MTVNLLILLAVSLTLTLRWVWLAGHARILTLTPAFGWLCAGGVTLALPLLWTPAQQLPVAAPRVAALAAGLALLLTGLQLRRRYQTAGLYVILAGVTLQALIAVQQLLQHRDAWVPLYGARAYGSFFQPNVLASFLATGLALAWALSLLPHFALPRATAERRRQGVLFLLIALFSALLVWLQSRVGWLGGLVVTGLFIWRLGRPFPHRCRQAVFAVGMGTTIGIGVLAFGGGAVVSISHDHSNLARWTMLRDTLAMIGDKPWQGWGYGSFEYAFQHFRINQTPPTPVTEIARHPHNELLLWVVEGGIVALCGLTLLLAGVIRIVRQALSRDRRAFAVGAPSAGLPTALCIALVPIALHTQLEFPFYLSAAHALTFLFLLALTDRVGGARGPTLPPRGNRTLATGMAALAVGGVFITGFALQGHLALSQVERFGMEDVTPLQTQPAPARWLSGERMTFDRQVNALLTYNHTRDERLLEHYRQWAESYLQQRIDKNVYANLVLILRHQQRPDDAERYRRDAARFFPSDERFVPPPPGNREGA
ncbi:PglL family O-oligosaccharyltransferase [Serratia marcescens]|uniref:PglL family O-oligosaccharyltransferase n=1 Tax=Serratia marcescens TaxID=615 RepID=UPI000F7E1181|nr:O-antigen ligase family protein [Serratia marcescens]RTF43127.1 polymerase [Serratia marcescens]RTF49515.1 polymerase [Serratia marcescens]